mmetsp:Transcript_60051/g.168319  ORF Transcript_60051/g.168319 Transcript_60051/m.168319 type:complete len:218 (+) Transcript_60051:146-799(+)
MSFPLGSEYQKLSIINLITRWPKDKNTRNLSLEVFEDSLSVNKLLGHETGCGKHGKTTVLKLLRLKGEELLSIVRLQAKGIKSKISRDIAVTKKTRLGNRYVLGFDPSDGGSLLFGGSDGRDQKGPEKRRDLSKVSDGRTRHLGIEKERRSFDLLSDEETDDSKHGNTTVGQFSLPVTLEGGRIGLLGESKRVEDSDRGESTGNVINGELDGGGLSA